MWLGAVVAMVGTGAAWGAWVASEDPAALALALGAQLIGTLFMVGVTDRVSRSDRDRRALTAALAFTVPVVGSLAVAWTCGTRGHGGAELLVEPTPEASVPHGLEIAQRLTTSLPPCEALVSGDVDARRATIARLTARASADDLAILRWARTQADPELVVEVALALEEIGQQFEQRTRAALEAATATPCFATHAAVVRVICDAISAGLVEPPLVGKLAAEARAHHAAAIAIEPDRAVTLVAPLARLELAARRPERALAVLGRAIRDHADDDLVDAELVELYAEAAYATRRFELVIEPVRAVRVARGWS